MKEGRQAIGVVHHHCLDLCSGHSLIIGEREVKGETAFLTLGAAAAANRREPLRFPGQAVVPG